MVATNFSTFKSNQITLVSNLTIYIYSWRGGGTGRVGVDNVVKMDPWKGMFNIYLNIYRRIERGPFFIGLNCHLPCAFNDAILGFYTPQFSSHRPLCRKRHLYIQDKGEVETHPDEERSHMPFNKSIFTPPYLYTSWERKGSPIYSNTCLFITTRFMGYH